MAILTGPLMSLDARGTIGKTITYSKGKQRHYAKMRPVPSNPRTGSQLYIRLMVGYLTKCFSPMWLDEREYMIENWSSLTDQGNLSVFSAFMRFNMKRWAQRKGPSISGITLVEDESPVSEVSATIYGRNVEVSMSAGMEFGLRGYMIYRSSTELIFPEKHELVGIAKTIQDNDGFFIDKNVPAGTWYYKVCGFGGYGSIGPPSADVPVVMP